MSTPSHDFVTVEMRGLKAALVARARSERVSVSALVRGAVARELESANPSDLPAVATPGKGIPGSPTVKLSIRLTSGEAQQLIAEARRAGLSRSAFLAGLLANVPSLSGASVSHPDCLAALTASSAELSTLSRNVNHLTTLLRQGQARAAQEYRRVLDTLADDVRAHLSLAASVLADVQPSRRARRRNGSQPPEAS